MKHKDSELQKSYATALRYGTPAERAAARKAWLGAWVSHTGEGKGANKPPKSGYKVFGFTEMASRSGQLSLAAIAATQRGTRPATLEEIKEVLRSWGDSGNLWNSKSDHFNSHMVKKGWATFDKVKEVLTLTAYGKSLI